MSAIAPAWRGRIPRLLRALHGERGQVMPYLMFVMAVCGLFAIVVIDVGLFYNERSRAQAAADLATLAAAQDLPSYSNDPNFSSRIAAAKDTAKRYAATNGYDACGDGVDVGACDPNVTVQIRSGNEISGNPSDARMIEVVVRRNRPWLLGRLLQLPAVTIGARALAERNAQVRDVMVVFDRSGSMCIDSYGSLTSNCPNNPPTNPPPAPTAPAIPYLPSNPHNHPWQANHTHYWEPFDSVRDSAIWFSRLFVERLDGQNFDYMGFVSYSDTATVDLALGPTFDGDGDGDDAQGRTPPAFNAAVDAIRPAGTTNIGHGLYKARMQFAASGRAGSFRVIVLLSDGVANRYPRINGDEDGVNGWRTCSGSGVCTQANNYVTAQANAAAAAGIVIYTIGYGSYVDPTLLQQVAQIGGGQYFDAPTPAALDAAFRQIGDLLTAALKE